MIADFSVARRIQAAWSIDPAAPALEFEGHWSSWGELRRSAAAIDEMLTQAGVRPEAPVGVLLRNRPGLIAAILALLVSRRCIVSLSPFQSRAALHQDMSKLKMHAVIADAMDWRAQETRQVVRQLGIMAVSIESGGMAPLQVLTDFDATADHRAGMGDTALEILTSGTTGAPKRIRISHRTMNDSIEDGASAAGVAPINAAPTLKPTPTIVAAPLMHVSGLFGALLSVCEARPLVLLEKFSVDAWVEAIARHRIKFASLPPTPMRMVLDAQVPKAKLQSLIAVRAGTAPLPCETQREFQSRYGIPVLVQYGATEWMGGIAGWTLDDHEKFGAAKLGSVGRARGEVKLRVVHPDTGQEVPAGETGVLEVLPTQRLASTSWTRTSDLASLDVDGFLYIRGRTDDTIIRGGFKVQLNQVTEVLMRHEAVREAAVIGIPDARLGQVPAALVELRPGSAPVTEEELTAFAREHLSPYQVPAKVRIVAALPRTISMKVSRPGVAAFFEDT